ncbi:hypothetical protein EYC84_005377 [Monilinia fructicola]|uniref:Uncharacterized protein n=1 Tax=Monilinia fructicola TaxID=38448 RepID=A0A5M9JX75_MONFR|nr:hypothetical protein EYC84_005377 [Monilinia fructicola]
MTYNICSDSMTYNICSDSIFFIFGVEVDLAGLYFSFLLKRPRRRGKSISAGKDNQKGFIACICYYSVFFWLLRLLGGYLKCNKLFIDLICSAVPILRDHLGSCVPVLSVLCVSSVILSKCQDNVKF